jgi:hypothetical protein
VRGSSPRLPSGGSHAPERRSRISLSILGRPATRGRVDHAAVAHTWALPPLTMDGRRLDSDDRAQTSRVTRPGSQCWACAPTRCVVNLILSAIRPPSRHPDSRLPRGCWRRAKSVLYLVPRPTQPRAPTLTPTHSPQTTVLVPRKPLSSLSGWSWQQLPGG